MNMKFKNFRKSAELFGAMCGGLLITLPAIPQAVAQQSVTQQSTPKINPCPRIFYEEPHNSRVVVPQGCPANALTQRLAAQGLLPANPSQEQTRLGVGGEASQGTPSSTVNPNPSIGNQPQNTLQPDGSTQPSTSSEPGVSPATAVPGQTPLPSQQQAPNATIALTNGRVNIKLVNDTATNVTYQVIGDTAPRSLPAKSDATLQSLNAPVTVTFQREDGGQLTVTPQSSSEPGSLEVKFNEATDVAQGRNTMRIEQNGSLFLN